VPESDVPETDVPESDVPETDVAVTPEPYEPAPDEPAVGEAPVSEAPPDISEAPPDITDDDAPLLDGQRWKDRWDRIQIRFVDDPRQAIEDADALVDDVVTEVAAKLADERARLESQWNGGSEPSTEDLRQALQRYRRFLTRLLAA
jgi:hypothetical protein